MTPIFLNTDFYKTSHREQYPKGTTKVYSTLTPRSNKHAPWADNIVFFGLQYFIKEYLINRFNNEFFNQPKDEVVALYRDFITDTIGKDPDVTHLEKLHDLGYLPIEIKALTEGSLAPMRCPVMTIENTHPDFFWLTNFLETILSTTIWQPITSATLAYQYRKVLDDYAIKTTGSTAGVDYQGHDFSMRGMSSEQTAMASGMGHLTSFSGTDTIPAIFGANKYYNAPLTAQTGTSIPATEHSVMCSYGETNELELFKHLITTVYPSGFFSVVSDTWDFWKVVTEYLPALKSEIMARDGRVVIRPDSGDPVEIICGKEALRFETFDDMAFHYEGIIEETVAKSKAMPGEVNVDDVDEQLVYIEEFDSYFLVYVEYELDRIITDEGDKLYYAKSGKFEYEDIDLALEAESKGLIECLWDTFGGTINDQGYKVLNPHIGAIYGDSITLERATEICRRLEAKGFASTNIVFGIGSFSYQYHTRDTFGFAVKATYAVVNGEERLLFKDPKTDDGTKRSQRGRVVVGKSTLHDVVKDKLTGDQSNNHIVWLDGLNQKEQGDLEVQNFNLLQPVFKDGILLKDYTLDEIRQNLRK